MRRKNSKTRAYQRALGLGTIAGLRSLSAPAVLSYAASQNDLGFHNTPFALLESAQVTVGSGIMAAGEMVADKMPFMPDRTSPPALLGRVGIGALMGAAVFSVEDEPIAVGAAVGAVAALAATFGGYYLRSSATNKLGVPNVVAGLVEDAIVACSGWSLIQTTTE